MQKIQDELIAREIVINDADSAVRYKLTKRQTQEEIQKCTGAVVITRGKYRPPSAAPDGLETIVKRIKAVDLATTMVEEMLKQGSINNVGTVTNHLSTCVYLGFEADPSLNIAARIRGPNVFSLTLYEANRLILDLCWTVSIHVCICLALVPQLDMEDEVKELEHSSLQETLDRKLKELDKKLEQKETMLASVTWQVLFVAFFATVASKYVQHIT
ncbi:unnamed protein product [Camellia sinensis]